MTINDLMMVIAFSLVGFVLIYFTTYAIETIYEEYKYYRQNVDAIGSIRNIVYIIFTFVVFWFFYLYAVIDCYD